MLREEPMVHQYSGVELDTLKVVFDTFDKEGSGHIDLIDMQEICLNLNREVAECKNRV